MTGLVVAAFVALAGGLGAVARFVVDGFIRGRFKTVIPAGTVFINVSGSLVLGLLAGLVIAGSSVPEVQSVLGTGFLGGYTTFSTANVETVRLVQSRRTGRAIINALGTMAATLLAAGLGLLAGLVV